MKARRLLETALYASDLTATLRFYRDVLGLEMVSSMGRRGAALRCGPSVLLVFNPEHSRTAEGGVPGHGAVGPGHVAFTAEAGELDGWRRHLAACGVEIESEVDWPGGGRSIYFRDPAGNVVELAPSNLWWTEA